MDSGGSTSQSRWYPELSLPDKEMNDQFLTGVRHYKHGRVEQAILEFQKVGNSFKDFHEFL